MGKLTLFSVEILKFIVAIVKNKVALTLGERFLYNSEVSRLTAISKGR